MMRPRYSTGYLERVYGGASVFDLWSILTTLERCISVPERSWLFCRLVEWMSATRSSVWTYYEATDKALQSQISCSLQGHPELGTISEYFDRGARTWTSELEIDQVDQWIDSHEQQIHSALMQFAREDMRTIIELNARTSTASNDVPATTNQESGVSESPP